MTARDPSADSSNAERCEARWLELTCELLFALQVGQVETAGLGGESKVIGGQDSQRKTHLRANGIERGVEGFFRDAEVGHLDRHDAALAPYEQRKRRQQRR